MLKKLLLMLLSCSLCFADDVDTSYMSRRTKALCGVLVVGGGIAAAPFVLPAATIAAIQAAAVAAAAKIAAASAIASTTVGTTVTAVAGTTIGTAAGTAAGAIVSVPTIVGVGIEGVKLARPYVFQTEYEELVYLEKSEIQEFLQQRSDLLSCLIKNKKDSKKGSFGCSPSCQQLAFEFQLLAGKTGLQKAIKSV
jgi:hypothetical protein